MGYHISTSLGRYCERHLDVKGESTWYSIEYESSLLLKERETARREAGGGLGRSVYWLRRPIVSTIPELTPRSTSRIAFYTATIVVDDD